MLYAATSVKSCVPQGRSPWTWSPRRRSGALYEPGPARLRPYEWSWTLQNMNSSALGRFAVEYQLSVFSVPSYRLSLNGTVLCCSPGGELDGHAASPDHQGRDISVRTEDQEAGEVPAHRGARTAVRLQPGL